MSDIILYPDPRLRQRCEPVTSFESPAPKALSAIWSQMYHAMKAAGGIGLAASQLGIMRRIIVIACDGTFPDDSVVMINPVVLPLPGARRVTMVEGCLSMPGIEGPVARSDRIGVAWQDERGCRHTADLNGVHARVVQHEVDHLNRILFTDRISHRNQKVMGWDARAEERREIAAQIPR